VRCSMSNDLSLRELTPENWEQVVALSVAAEQQDFVDMNLYALAESKVMAWGEPVAIYAGEEPVGMMVYGEAGEGRCLIHHVIVDRRHQGAGYGRAALGEAIRRLRARTGCTVIELSYWPGNPAVRLYERLGFRYTGSIGARSR
jgi:diamine N-acetyltransferase